MKHKMRLRRMWRLVCLSLIAIAVVATAQGVAETSNNASTVVAPALKCADLAGFKISESAMINTALEVREAQPGTVQPLPQSPSPRGNR